ncbi:MAG TPA: DUF2232 domain-containing protein [Firmicutes bacterium]|nr:DUF2232 domain-containing protein [Candidatus Fermentithermobacillaceae bacterium]
MTDRNHADARGRGQRALVESAFLAALAVVIILLAEYAPVIGIGAAFLGPVPVAVVVSRHGLKWGVLSAVVATLISMAFLNPIVALGAGLVLVLGGLSLGYGIMKKLDAQKTLLLMTIAAIFIAAVNVLLSVIALGLAPEALLRQATESMVSGMEQGAQLAAKLTGKPFDAAEWTSTRQAMITSLSETLRQTIVGLLVTAAAIHAYLNYTVSGAVLRRFGVPVNELPPFSRWIFPPWFGLLFFLASTVPAAFANQLAAYPLIRAVVMNLIAGTSFFMLFEGLSLLAYYLKEAKMPGFLIVFLSIYIVTSPSFSFVAQLCGALDAMMDLRRIRWGNLEDL